MSPTTNSRWLTFLPVRSFSAAMCPSKEIAALVKQHNNANVIALGGRFTSPEDAKDIVDSYMEAQFEGGRHQTRVDKIMALEKQN